MARPVPLTPDQKAEVLRLTDTKGKLNAVLFVRRALGVGLAEALAAIDDALREAGRMPRDTRGQVSLDFYALGVFRRALIQHFDYDESFYESTREGTPVLVHLFEVYKDTQEATDLATWLGAELQDASTHALDAARVDVEALASWDEWGSDLADSFVALQDAGFRFFLLVRAE